MGRTKGEASRNKSRPSSSSLAASLLPSDATTVGFGGFVGSSRVDSSPSSSSDGFVVQDMDSELALQLRRLSRKDPITKLKALSSLSQLSKQKSTSEIVTIIPQWAFDYKKLLLDYNREVRRATHETMTYLVRVVGRELAPHLKLLIGPWFFSQFDPLSEVSQAAKLSFQTAFPAKERRLDALMMYSSEIFAYIEENLKLTPQSISNKANPSDELEEIYQMVLSSSLLAMAAFLDIFNLTSETKHSLMARTTAVSMAAKLFTAHNYFLNFLKSPSPAVRTAAYSAVKSCIKNIPHAINDGDMKTVSAAIFGTLQETNPACHSFMWETVLLLTKKFPDCWGTVNVEKTVLRRLWIFLQNGCFGSQKVSYPALLLFLDTLPAQAISGENFALEFFQNLFAGKKHSCSSSADREAFFLAVEECFLWVLRNSSRYTDVNAIHSYQRTLIDNILLGILWNEYRQLTAGFKCTGTASSLRILDTSDNPIQSMHKESSRESVKSDYLSDYEKSLGKCIVKILSGINLLNQDLLLIFCSKFQTDCLDMLQPTECSSQNVGCFINFFELLDQYAVQQGDSWPWIDLVGPTLRKAFPLIGTLDSSDAVKLVTTSVSLFGRRKVVQELMGIGMGSEQFLESFIEVIVPLCLQTFSPSTSARLDLLLALLDDQCFTEQWDGIITYLVDSKNIDANSSIDGNTVNLLTILMETVRQRATNLSYQYTSYENWHHNLLDSVAISVVRTFSQYEHLGPRFILAVLGGRLEDDKRSFVSQKTVMLIFEEVFDMLVAFMMDSTFVWVKDACSLLVTGRSHPRLSLESSDYPVGLAKFSLDILNSCLFCLTTIGTCSELVQGILVAVFIIDWEFSWINVAENQLEEQNAGKIEARFAFRDSARALRCKICNKLLKIVVENSRKSLGITLIQSIKSLSNAENGFDSDHFLSFCCQRVVDIFEDLCEDPVEEQKLLDQLLSQNESWPQWTVPDMDSVAKLNDGSIYSKESKNPKFIALLDKLISKIGFDQVVAGVVSNETYSPMKVDFIHSEVASQYPRTWLAAEILCAWKWPGGSALLSFLPSFSNYVKERDSSFLDSVLNILLDGAVAHGSCCRLNLLLPASFDEVEEIKEPFLRALLSLLSIVSQNNIWGKEKVLSLFKQLHELLYIGDTANINCLRILPSIMSILVRSLGTPVDDFSKDLHDPCCHELHNATINWLERIVSFPPLNAWQTGTDMEDWFHLVVSCFPIKGEERMQGLRGERYICSSEIASLYKLFQKQRLCSAAVENKLPFVQTLFSKLMAISVAYCWENFDEDDWKFFFHRLRFCIEPAVVVMEENAENVNDAVVMSTNNVNVTLNVIKDAVQIRDPFPIEIAKDAILGFSIFCNLVELQKRDDVNSILLDDERWEFIVDRILEGILRLFFSTAAAEAIASTCCRDAAFMIASSRVDQSQFWELVASCVVRSSSRARDQAIKSVEMWGLDKGPISSLYTLVFSCKPQPALQLASFVLLSNEPVAHSALWLVTDKVFSSDSSISEISHELDTSSPENIHLREEISCHLQKLPHEVFELDLLEHERVNTFVAWCLLLSHLTSSSSTDRERLTRYVQEVTDAAILDCLFQHIPVELMGTNSRKKDSEIPAEVSAAAGAAVQAITTGSVSFCIELLWPIGSKTMASVAGAIFGMMLRNLPAYVRGWFTEIKDRSMSAAIESFTKSWCSPILISDELSQVQKAHFADDSFSVSVSKSANEIVATYTKDETGMDLLIRFPQSYPLKLVDVDCTRSLGISEVKRRKWLLSLVSFVRNQNGALAEAIRIWKSNFDKAFGGIEECPICYSVIHSSNHSLPRLACKTCKHKFHSACLYKWFSTSQKSVCPLCQSPF